MVFIDKTTFYKRGESGRGRERFKKNDAANSFFF